MGKEQKLKMKEAYDLFILIFMSCNRRKSKQCPFALGKKSPCKEKYILNKAHKVRQICLLFWQNQGSWNRCRKRNHWLCCHDQTIHMIPITTMHQLLLTTWKMLIWRQTCGLWWGKSLGKNWNDFLKYNWNAKLSLRCIKIQIWKCSFLQIYHYCKQCCIKAWACSGDAP